MAHQPNITINGERLQLDSLGPRLVKTGGIVGFAALGVSLVMGITGGETGMKHFFFAYLVAYCFFLSLSLGGLFFVIIQHLCRARWSVVVRRLAEIIAANTMLMAVLMIPLLFGFRYLYGWTSHEIVSGDRLLEGKAPYLNVPFFLVRCVVYFGIWIGMSRFFLNQSRAQDVTGDVVHTQRMEKLSAPGILLFALTTHYASIDLIMSLDAHWFSTIFGLYFFSGSVVAFMSLLAVVSIWIQSRGRIANAISAEHYHDIGKLMFGFVFFWGYIAFSQYMLIWYGNLPEETGWFLRRQSGGWLWVALALVFGHFLIPFSGLLSRHVKRNRLALLGWAVWLLLMHWIDLYWLIIPEMNAEGIPFGIVDIGCMVGLGGLFVAGLAKTAQTQALIPVQDPRLDRSLSFHNI